MYSNTHYYTNTDYHRPSCLSNLYDVHFMTHNLENGTGTLPVLQNGRWTSCIYPGILITRFYNIGDDDTHVRYLSS